MTGFADGIRCVAFYLPQYHPIPENDEWWGRGFTEWTNVTTGRPRFRGHYQPHLPADLGFYDLRVPEVRTAQADLATEYGIDGFCYYHYWFNGHRLLERPFDEVLESGDPKFPFCLCWANENWTRVWDGGSAKVLIAQQYSAEDDAAHIRSLCAAFDDPRYIRIGGRPVFLVYRASAFPDPRATTDLWRQVARAEGIDDLYLCRVEATELDRGDVNALGFDASVEFQPDTGCYGPRRRHKIPHRVAHKLLAPRSAFRWNEVLDYGDLVARSLDKGATRGRRFRCVMPSFDNSARRASFATIFTGSTPEQYGSWLTKTIQQSRPIAGDENLIFVNAWNEWAEGNHMEPDQEFGSAFLEAHAAGRRRASEGER